MSQYHDAFQTPVRLMFKEYRKSGSPVGLRTRKSEREKECSESVEILSCQVRILYANGSVCRDGFCAKIWTTKRLSSFDSVANLLRIAAWIFLA